MRRLGYTAARDLRRLPNLSGHSAERARLALRRSRHDSADQHKDINARFPDVFEAEFGTLRGANDAAVTT